MPVQALWLVILPSPPSRRPRRWLAVGLYLAALILPYLPLLRWQAPTWLSLTYQTGHPFVPLGDILLVLTSVFSRGVLPVEQPATLLPYLLSLTAGAILWPLEARNRTTEGGSGRWRVVALLLIWLLLPPLAVYGVSLGMPLFTDRYLIWAMPAFLALAGLGIVALARTWRPLGWVTLAAILALNLLGAGMQTVRPIKADLRAAVGYVAAHRQNPDRLVYQIPHIRYTFSYYASGFADDRNDQRSCFLRHGRPVYQQRDDRSRGRRPDGARNRRRQGRLADRLRDADVGSARADGAVAGRARHTHAPCRFRAGIRHALRVTTMTSATSDITFLTPSGLAVTLSPDEYRLALLWLFDFEAAWDGLEAATMFVTAGEAKLALIHQRVRPLAADLAPLGERVDALALLAARHWFRYGSVTMDRAAEAAA